MEKGKRVRRLVLLCMLTCLLVGLTACGQPKLKESQIKADLEQSIRFDGQKLELENIRVERRQSNEKNEIVYCAAVYGNEQYGITVYYLQSYSYYDQGGWFLDETNEYQEQEAVARSGVSEKQMADYLKREFGPSAQYEIISQETDLSRSNDGWKREKDTLTYRVWQDGSILSYESTGTYSWKMSDSGWRAGKNNYTTTYSIGDITGDWYGEVPGSFNMLEHHLTIHEIQWDGTTGSVLISYEKEEEFWGKISLDTYADHELMEMDEETINIGSDECRMALTFSTSKEYRYSGGNYDIVLGSEHMWIEYGTRYRELSRTKPN